MVLKSRADGAGVTIFASGSLLFFLIDRSSFILRSIVGDCGPPYYNTKDMEEFREIGRWIEFVLVFRYNTNKIPADVWLATDWQPKAGSVHS